MNSFRSALPWQPGTFARGWLAAMNAAPRVDPNETRRDVSHPPGPVADELFHNVSFMGRPALCDTNPGRLRCIEDCVPTGTSCVICPRHMEADVDVGLAGRPICIGFVTSGMHKRRFWSTFLANLACAKPLRSNITGKRDMSRCTVGFLIGAFEALSRHIGVRTTSNGCRRRLYTKRL